MCGIAAIVEADKSPVVMSRAEMEARLVRMLAAIRHRGDPFNFAETHVDEKFALGMNRLAIVDREHGRQPVTDASGRYFCILNGEIYNYRDLRSELVEKGYPFETETDTETLLYAYIEWGREFIDRLDGIFAFVIYDSGEGRLFVARDHIGIKPLYYALSGGYLHLASEKKCFIGMDILYEDFPPGHFYEDGRLHAYREYRAEPKAVSSEAEAIRRCRHVIEEAVRSQVRTDLPLAVVFSGGLDSTIMLHLARKHHPDVTAFSIGTAGSSDLEFARRYCAELGIRHIVTEVSGDQVERTVERAVYRGECFEPVDISDMVVMSIVYASIAAHGFKVAIAGDGSDELFAGYDLFRLVEDPYALTEYRLRNLHRTDLQRTDRSSMAHSVESRVPFLADAVIRFACSVPFDLKVRNGVEKYILREAFRGDMPDYMLDRPKIRMPEGIGINDVVFNRLKDLGQGEFQPGDEFVVDSPQVLSGLRLYRGYGYNPPARRYKTVGLDYFAGGYFRFGADGGA
jgi:asparagine synthase (glutamine-hydrolysing)